MSINKVILIGNVGKDPEIRTFADGGMIAGFSLATSKSWLDQNGQRQEKSNWNRIVAKGKQAEKVQRRVKKGTMIYVEGELETRSYDDNGTTRYVTEVVIFVSRVLKGGIEQQGGGTVQNTVQQPQQGGFQPQQNTNPTGYTGHGGDYSPSFEDDSIPF
jgi:single-strand DNA-binding protein